MAVVQGLHVLYKTGLYCSICLQYGVSKTYVKCGLGKKP